jgi:type IV secretion system protein VirB4
MDTLRPLLEQSCPQKIATPNPEAMSADVAKIYEGMGFSETLIEQIATRRARHDYLLISPYGRRWFQLDLGGVLSVFCGSSNAPEETALIDRVLEESPDEPFAVAYLVAKGYEAEAQQFAQRLQEGRHAAAD